MRIIRSLIVLLFFALVPRGIFAQGAPVRVIYHPPWNISKLPMYLARERGVFERHGLKIAWISPGSNDNLLAALKQGEADIAVVSANHIAQNNTSGGAPMRLVGNTGYNYSAFLAGPTIKSAGDLKGKKVGSGEKGSTPDQLTRLALKKLGIDPEQDVTLVNLDGSRNSTRVKSLLSGEIAGMMVTAETLYDLEKNGQISQFNKLTDHRQLQIYAGGGADYAVTEEFLKHRRNDAKRFMAGICEGIGIARKDKAEALKFVAKTGSKLDAAGIEYLYQLYIKDVIPARPYLKPEGIDLAIQMNGTLNPASGPINPKDLVDSTLIPELVSEGLCNY